MLEETTVQDAIITMAKSDHSKMIAVMLMNGSEIIGEIGTILADGFIFNRTNERPPQKAFVRWDHVVCVTIL